MRLFVANCTRQPKEVYYRLDFNPDGSRNANSNFQPAKRQTIPPGRQINLGGDLTMPQITDIVDQLKKYGLVGVVDVPRIKKAAPYVFDIDKHVSTATINTVMKVNSGILIEEGKQRRARAAIAANNTVADVVESQFSDAGIPKQPEQDVEIEIEQLEQSEEGENRIEEGYRMDANATAPAKPSGRAPAPRKKTK